MQQPPTMMPVMPSFNPANITTEQIQKYLDENKKLILAIMDNQNLGKLAECAQYQAQLQKNLMYLAAIADAQPQMPAMPAQMAPHPAMQQGAFYMQHPQVVAMAQQQGIFPSKMPVQFASPHHLHEQQQQQQLLQQHQHATVGQGHMHIQPGGTSNVVHSMQKEGAVDVGSSGGPPPPAVGSDPRGGTKQDAADTGKAQGNSVAE